MLFDKRYLIGIGLGIWVVAVLASPSVNAQSDSAGSSLKDSERASIMFDFNLKKIRDHEMMKDFDLVEMMQKNGIPQSDDFDIKKVNRIFGGVQIPGNPAAFQPQPGADLETNFFVRFEFSDAAAATQMIDSFKDKGTKTHDVGGKTYYSPDDGQAPPNLRLHKADDNTVEMGTARYVFQKDRKLQTAQLGEYWKQIPNDAAWRISVDLESNRAVIDQMMQMASATAPPDAEPFLKIVNDLAALSLAVDFSSDKMLMLRAIGKNSEGAERLQAGIDGMLGMGKFFGQQGLSQSGLDEQAQKVFGAFLKSLKANSDGNTVKVDVVKPEGFDEVIANMLKQ